MPTPCVGVKELSAIVDSLSAARLADADRLDDAAQRIEHLEAQLLERDSQQSQQVAEAKKLRDELVGYRASSASLETLEREHKQLLQEHHALKAALERLWGMASQPVGRSLGSGRAISRGSSGTA